MQNQLKRIKSRNLSVSFVRENNIIEGLTKNYKAVPEFNYNDGSNYIGQFEFGLKNGYGIYIINRKNKF